MDEIMPLRTPIFCLTILCAGLTATASAAEPKPARAARPSSFKELIDVAVAQDDSPKAARSSPAATADRTTDVSPVSFKELIDLPPSPEDPPQPVRSPHGSKADRAADLARLDQFSLMR